MPVIELGRRPELLRVMLIPGRSFFAEIELKDEDDHYEVAPALAFNLDSGEVVRWDAVLITPKVAQFTADAAQVDSLIPLARNRTAIVEYDGQVWYAGKFEVLGD